MIRSKRARRGGDDLSVLLVDDNPDDRALVRRTLRKGFAPLNVTEVGTAAGFREALDSDEISVVITDYALQWGNGLEVLHQVRSRWPQCAVIMFTDTGSEEVAARAMKDGLDDYVVKSSRHAEQLPVAVQRALTHRMHRKRARAAEAHIRALFDRLPAGVYRVNQDDRVLYANETLADILGFDSAEELIGESIAGIVTDWQEAEKRRRQKGGGVVTSTVRVRRRDGRVIWIRDSGQLVHDVDGTPLYYEGVVQDVTQAQEARLEVRRQSRFVALLQAVTATANEYDTLDEALGPALVLIRRALDWPAAHIYRWNGSVLEPTEIWADDGSERFGAFRERTTDLAFAPGEGLPGRAMARRSTAWIEDLENDPEFVRITPDLADGFATGTAVPVVLDDEVLAVFELYHDRRQARDEALIRVLDKAGVQLGRVAERERAEVTRREMEAAAEETQRLDAVGRLAGGIAHDFNNLLTVIRSQADLLYMDLPEDDALREEVAAIQMAADRAAGLTSQLLTFSREQVLEPRVVDLNDVVVELTRLLERIIGEDIEVIQSLDDDFPPIEVDPTQLEQGIINLAVNARHAMPHGGTLTLATGTHDIGEDTLPDLPAGRYVCLRVTDSGVGMDEETRERIFEPFFTTKSADQGTGLGLAMVHGFVRQSGGAITVESAPGEGATFTLLFPPSDGQPGLTDADAADVTPEVERLTGRVLVVEDEAAVRGMIRKSLERAGFRVGTADDGETGLAVLEAEEYDVLLTDLLLPGMNGDELAARARDLRPEIGVLLMSGYTEGALDDERNPLPHRARFIQKPFTVRELTRAIREILASDGGAGA